MANYVAHQLHHVSSEQRFKKAATNEPTVSSISTIFKVPYAPKVTHQAACTSRQSAYIFTTAGIPSGKMPRHRRYPRLVGGIGRFKPYYNRTQDQMVGLMLALELNLLMMAKSLLILMK